MRVLRLLLTPTIAVLVATTPYTTDAAGRGGMGHSGGFRAPVRGAVGPHRVFAAPHLGVVAPGVLVAPHLGVVSRFHGPRRFVPFIGGFDPSVVIVLVPLELEAGGETLVAQPAPPAPVPEPKNLFPPPPSPPSPAGMHTVIVQHGARIEVHQVPE